MASLDRIQVENFQKNIEFMATYVGDSHEKSELANVLAKQQDDMAKIPAVLEASVEKNS